MTMIVIKTEQENAIIKYMNLKTSIEMANQFNALMQRYFGNHG